LVYIMTSSLPYAVLFILCQVEGHYFEHFPDPATLVAYVAALFLGFAVGFFFEATIGMIGFWFLEVTSVLYVINTVNFFVSGHMFPIDMLPAPFAAILKALPFQYLAYFPAAIFLGKIHGDELVDRLLAELAWA